VSENDPRELGGADPIDARLPAAEAVPTLARFAAPLRTHAALGLEAAHAPALVFVPLGFVLGPRAVGLLPEDALAHLDVVVSVALAALGVFIGLALDLRRGRERRLLAAASTEALVTLAVVAGSLAVLLERWRVPLDAPVVTVAAALGACAAASSGRALGGDADPVHALAARIADLDDVVPIVVGAFVIAMIGVGSGVAVAQAVLVTGLVGLGVGFGGWLLFERARGAAERGVFVLGSVVLVGGGAAYMAQSALLAGMVAGLFWRLAPGRADRVIHDDLRRIQHPLVVLLLLAAGASLEPSRVALWFLVPLVLFRLVGKLLGGWAAARLVPGAPAPADLGAHLLPPGVIGIAFALGFQQMSASSTGSAVMAATAVASLAGEILAVAALAGLRRA
jgi:hypothetical protein